MSNNNITESILSGISSLFVLFILLILFLFTFFFLGVVYITPQAELPRNKDGLFIVNSNNYNYWHTYSRLLNSSSNIAILDGEYVIRTIKDIEESCDGIKNCQQYESKFYKLAKSKDVWLIKKSDDKKVIDHINLLSKEISRHNKKIVDYSTKVKFKKPDFPDIFLVKLNKFNINKDSNYRDMHHNKIINTAKSKCQNNGIGCEVRAYVKYNYFIYPSLDIGVN